jgi:hypothetical protein
MRITTSTLCLALAACGAAAPPPPAAQDPDLDMKAEDFGCILEWDKVRRFRVTNKLGFLAETLAVANAGKGAFPPGTIVQLVPDEAMVKRRRGWNAATNDWEFFALSTNADGTTTIRARGAEETKNAFGGNCFDCHSKAAPEYDLLCETGHGCDPIPLSPSVIESIQSSDGRCR